MQCYLDRHNNEVSFYVGFYINNITHTHTNRLSALCYFIIYFISYKIYEIADPQLCDVVTARVPDPSVSAEMSARKVISVSKTPTGSGGYKPIMFLRIK